jgi:AcrR family transcriptional regulator
VPAVKSHTADLAVRLVDEAGRILAAHGASALTLRRLAQVAGTSTMAVYSLFGDKQGLLTAMYREGFARLGRELDAAAAVHDDPLAALGELGLAYRRVALANPHLYQLMFGPPVAVFSPDAQSRELAAAAYRPLVATVQRCLDAGVVTGGAAERIARYLWAVSHGMVSLELAGQLDVDEGRRAIDYRDALVLSAAPFLPA